MKSKDRLWILIWPILALTVIGLLLLFERSGISYRVSHVETEFLSMDFVKQSKAAKHKTIDCLLIVNSRQETHAEFYDHMTVVLDNMSVGYDVVDLAKGGFPKLQGYATAVVLCPDLSPFQDNIFTLCDWVEAGGRCMFFATLDPTVVFRSIASKLGIVDGGVGYTSVVGLKIQDNFMVGAAGFEYAWEEPSASVLDVRLDAACTVHVASNGANAVPMLWERNYGKGRFVVNNHGMCEKVTRGLTAAAYSLLQDVFAYPVINSSVFFLDDFPSPVPMGNGEYIRKYFGRDISSFYSNIWWPDMLKIAEKHGVRYTGVVIEDYSERTSGTFPRTTDTERFRYFGGLLLETGGEIGIHGYNHMPLCPDGFDFLGKVDYETWPTANDMRSAIAELMDFTKTLFPKNTISTYVPPSNILSAEGRAMLAESFPEIRTLSGVFLKEDYEYEQEFCVSDDGIVELPRIISGAILDPYMRWAAFNELNFQYVNSHFIHPDDVLDEDRGAALGWNTLRDNLDGYMDWLYGAAPGLRNQTAAEASRAVQRYDCLTVDRTLENGVYRLNLQGFADEAYLLLRLDGRCQKITGGSLEQVNGSLYVLRATAPEVTVVLAS